MHGAAAVHRANRARSRSNEAHTDVDVERAGSRLCAQRVSVQTIEHEVRRAVRIDDDLVRSGHTLDAWRGELRLEQHARVAVADIEHATQRE